MEFRLEIDPLNPKSNLLFKTIYFKAFKINIIERYSGKGFKNIHHIIIKLRSLDDEIIPTISGASRIKVKESFYQHYLKMCQLLSSYEYRNKLIDTKPVEDQFVNFILSQMIGKYEL